MAVQLGLKFDLSPWRKGVRSASDLVKKGLGAGVMGPFDRGVAKSVAGAKKLFGGMASAVGGALKSALGPLLAIFAVAKVLSVLKDAFTSAFTRAQEYADSVSTLQAALRATGETNVDGATASVRKLGDQLRLSLGIANADTNKVFGDFLTKGFDQSQSRTLTLLASNYAKKVGKPVEEVAAQVAAAANGKLGALKALGITIASTGDKTQDAMNAVIAMKAAYGDIGADLADPQERLGAAWENISLVLGEKILPVIEPIVERFADFLNGLSQTEEGRALVEKLGGALKWVVDMIVKGANDADSMFTGLTSGVEALTNLILSGASRVIEKVLGISDAITGSALGRLLAAGGIDLGEVRGTLKGFADVSSEKAAAASEKFTGAAQRFANGEQGNLVGKINSIADAGAKMRTDAAASLSAEIAATKGVGFAGKGVGEDDDDAKEEEKAEKARAKAVAKNGARKFTGSAQVAPSQQISVRVLSTRPDRFRRARVPSR